MATYKLSREHHALLLRQMDAKLQEVRTTALPTVPRKGWIEAIRTALGMSVAQLAARLSMTESGVRKLEESETQRTISLQTLDKVAEAMHCRVYYVLIPDASLTEVCEEQARYVSASLVGKVAHSMSLESQRVSDEETARQIDEAANRLLQDEGKKLWQSR